jgi:hypothetical protein
VKYLRYYFGDFLDDFVDGILSWDDFVKIKFTQLKSEFIRWAQHVFAVSSYGLLSHTQYEGKRVDIYIIFLFRVYFFLSSSLYPSIGPIEWGVVLANRKEIFSSEETFVAHSFSSVVTDDGFGREKQLIGSCLNEIKYSASTLLLINHSCVR